MAALRELGEETGVSIEDEKRLKMLPSLNTIPSRTAQMMQIYQVNITKEEYEKRVFEFFEKQRNEQNIRFYGLATWECFRVSKESSNFLSLTQVIDLAKQVGGSTHGFRFIQLPYNLQFDQAYMQRNQPVDSNELSILELAKQSDIGVFTSVPLMQGKLLEWIKNKPEFTHQSPSVNALQFIRSTPGVLAPLVGQKLDLHVKENLQVLEIPPFSEEEFSSLLKKLVQ